MKKNWEQNNKCSSLEMASSLDLLEESQPVVGIVRAGDRALADSANLIDSESMGLLGDTTAEITGLDSQPQEEEELTAAEVLKRLQDAWVNEKFAPELLDPQIEVVDCLLDQLDNTEQTLKVKDWQIILMRILGLSFCTFSGISGMLFFYWT